MKVYIKISIGKRKNNVHLSLFSCIKLNVFRVEIGIKSGKVKVVSFYAQFEWRWISFYVLHIFCLSTWHLRNAGLYAY